MGRDGWKWERNGKGLMEMGKEWERMDGNGNVMGMENEWAW